MAETFTTEILLHGKTATYFAVPADVVAALSDRKRVPVTVTINDHSYRSTIAPMGGGFMLPLNRTNRAGARVAAGDEVEVTIDVDPEPRVVEVPDDFHAALQADPPAAERFMAMSYSHKRQYVEWIGEAKRPETRERRIGRAVAMIREGKAQR